MGFLDKVTKGITETVEGISKAVSDATTTSTTGGTGTAPAPMPASGGDLMPSVDPGDWFTSERLSEHLSEVGIEGLVFGPVQEFTRDDAVVARHVSTDGGFTVDLACVTEEYVARHGTAQAVLQSFATDLVSAEYDELPGYDHCLGGSSGPGHDRFVGCLGDFVGRVDVYAGANQDVNGVAQRLLTEGVGFDV